MDEMVYQELVKYVRDARAKGASDEDIRNALLNAGWGGDDVDVSLKVASRLDDKLADAVQPGPTQPQVVEQKAFTPPADDKPSRPAIFTSKEIKTEANEQVTEVRPPRELLAQAAESKDAEARIDALTTVKASDPKALPVATQARPAAMANTAPVQVEPIDSPGGSYQSGDLPPFYAHWLSVLFHPTNAFKREMYHASLGRSYANVLVPLALVILAAFGISLTGAASALAQANPSLAMVSALGPLILLAFPLVAIVYSALVFVIVMLSAIPSFLFAWLLSGQNRFSQHVHSLTVMMPGMMLLGVIVGVIGAVASMAAPEAGMLVIIPLALIFGLWQLVLNVIAVKVAYGVGLGKALAAVLLPIIILVALIVGVLMTIMSSFARYPGL